MTKLLDAAVDCLRDLPDEMQDVVARQLIRRFNLEEETEAGDFDAIKAGREDMRAGNYVSHDQLRHELGLADR